MFSLIFVLMFALQESEFPQIPEPDFAGDRILGGLLDRIEARLQEDHEAVTKRFSTLEDRLKELRDKMNSESTVDQERAGLFRQLAADLEAHRKELSASRKIEADERSGWLNTLRERLDRREELEAKREPIFKRLFDELEESRKQRIELGESRSNSLFYVMISVCACCAVATLIYVGSWFRR